MDNKRFVKFYKPTQLLTFQETWVYSLLHTLKAKRSYSVQLIAKLSGLARNTVAKIRGSLINKGLCRKLHSGRLAIIVPDNFLKVVSKNGKTIELYVKIYVPSQQSPLTLAQNAVYWLLQSYKNKRNTIGYRGVATRLSLGISTVKRALSVLKTYKPVADHFEDLRGKPIEPERKDSVKAVVALMQRDGFSQTEIAEMFKLSYNNEELLTRKYHEAKRKNQYAGSCVNLLRYMLTNVKKQPKAWTEDEQKEHDMSYDPIQGQQAEYLSAGDFVGRVRITLRQFEALVTKYSKTLLLETLKTMPMNEVTIEDFETLLKGA